VGIVVAGENSSNDNADNLHRSWRRSFRIRQRVRHQCICASTRSTRARGTRGAADGGSRAEGVLPIDGDARMYIKCISYWRMKKTKSHLSWGEDVRTAARYCLNTQGKLSEHVSTIAICELSLGVKVTYESEHRQHLISRPSPGAVST
jgi:hypothetical protein